MEKRASLNQVKLLFFLSVVILNVSLSAQEVSFQQKIRLPLWAELDAYPGLNQAQSADAGIFDHAIGEMKKVAPFIIDGMVDGWEFDYTPSDKARGVAEYFEIRPIKNGDGGRRGIVYEDPWFDESRVHCWVSYERSDAEVNSYGHWSQIKNPRILGLGGGRVEKGFAGIEEAARNAVKDAVRTYFRKILRNKPKQITGRVLVNKVPAILIKSGEYQLQLDFFLETGIIKEYKAF